MIPLAQMRPIGLLLDRITGVETSGGPRAAERAIMADNVQRLFLGRQWSLRDRLELLTHLAGMVASGPLPPRSRDVIQGEITRLTLRILWSEGLMGDGAGPGESGSGVASRLLEFAASELLAPHGPQGGAFEVVMQRAKDLLSRHDVVAEIAADAALRDRLLDQIVRARARYQTLLV